MIYLDFESGVESDPFWDDVLVLLPLSDSGTSFTDYSPLANTVNMLGSVTGSNVFEQNSAVTLWGENTLQVSKDALTEPANLYINDTTVSLADTRDFCVEWSFYAIDGGWGSLVPLHAWFQARLPGDPMIGAGSLPTDKVRIRNAAATNLDSSAVTRNAWHHCAVQYVNDDSLAYLWVDGTQVGSLFNSFGPSTGFRFYSVVLNNVSSPGADSTAYDIHLANIRVTAANRYGSAGTISVPTGPWPIG